MHRADQVQSEFLWILKDQQLVNKTKEMYLLEFTIMIEIWVLIILLQAKGS